MLDQTLVREATRLTRAGQLVEATALLQRMLRGEFNPTPALRIAAVPNSIARLEPPTIDPKAHVVDERESRQPTQAFSAPQRRKSPARFDSMSEFSRIPICTQRSAYIPALPAVPPATFPPRSSRCVRGTDPKHLGRTALPCRPSFSMVIATQRCIPTTATGFSSSTLKRMSSNNEGALRPSARRPCLYSHHPYRRRRSCDIRTLEHSMVPATRGQAAARRLLHRSARAGRDEGNAAFLSRAFARGVVGLHSALRSSGTSPNFRISLASLNSPVAGSAVRLNAIAPAQPGLCESASARMTAALALRHSTASPAATPSSAST